LENIYEPAFKETSYGFRPGRSQITALRDIRKNFGGVIWLVEGDINKYFDMVDHQKLIHILETKINDKRFLQLIEAGLKARVMLPQGEIIQSDAGVPPPPTPKKGGGGEGGVLSPLLSNIYLNELDK
jgi:retron-type reverse transcriptase